MHFENGHEKRFKSDENYFYFLAKLKEIHPACPQRMSILQIFNYKNRYIDCRSKMNSIKSERFDGVYWKLWCKISICLYLNFLV